MARPSSGYNPSEYGRPKTHMIPEGVYQFTITNAYESSGKYGPQWAMEVQPVDPTQAKPTGDPYKFWVPEDGVVNAMFDAMGRCPYSVPDADYYPESVIGKVVWLEIKHEVPKSGKHKGKTFCNPYLYPKYTKDGAQEAPQRPVAASEPAFGATAPSSEFEPLDESIPF